MMLLAPTAAAIAGAIAIPALAVLYLLKLRRRPVRVSSTLLWKEAYEDLEANIPWRWVRPSWLVLVHLLLVGLLVLVIGRPAIGGGGPPVNRLVFIIDRSASMSASDGENGQTRLAEAKERTLRMVDDAMRIGRNVEVAVIGAAAEARGLTSLSTDRRLVRGMVESIEGTDQPLDLPAALDLAGAMLGERDRAASESAVASAGTMIIVVSDGSTASRALAAPPGAVVRLERVGPSPMMESGLAQGTTAPAEQDHDNVGIVAISARRDAENPASLRVFLEVLNASARDRDVAIVLTLGGVERQRAALVVPRARGGVAGQKATTVELTTRDAGVLTASLVGSDLLATDNQVSLTVAAPAAPSILLVTPDVPPGGEPAGEAEAERITPRWLLENILTELRPASLRTVSESESPALIAGAGAGFDLIVFDRVTPSAAPQMPSIVLGGGMPALGIDRTDGVAPEDRDFVLSWDRTHPLLRDVSLDTVFAVGGRVLTMRQGAAPGGVGHVVDLALGASGPLIRFVEASGVRHIVVAFDLEHSNWGVQVGFSIFLANAVDFLTLRPDDQSRSALRIADSIDVDVPASAARVVLGGPAPRQILVPAPVAGSTALRTVSLGRVERVGVYTVSPAQSRPPMVAVNLLDPTESSLRTADELSVRTRGGAKGGPGGPVLPREISHLLLMAILGLLVVEWVIYARTARV